MYYHGLLENIRLIKEHFPDFLIFIYVGSDYLQDFFKDISGITLSPNPNYANNNHWLNVINVDEQKYGRSIKGLIEKFKANNIEVRPVWMLNHLQKPFKHYQSYNIENAIKQIKNSLCIPSSTKLSNEDIEKIAWVMK